MLEFETCARSCGYKTHDIASVGLYTSAKLQYVIAITAVVNY